MKKNFLCLLKLMFATALVIVAILSIGNFYTEYVMVKRPVSVIYQTLGVYENNSIRVENAIRALPGLSRRCRTEFTILAKALANWEDVTIQANMSEGARLTSIRTSSNDAEDEFADGRVLAINKSEDFHLEGIVELSSTTEKATVEFLIYSGDREIGSFEQTFVVVRAPKDYFVFLIGYFGLLVCGTVIGMRSSVSNR